MQCNSASPSNGSSEPEATERFGRLVTGVFRQWRRQVDQIFREIDLSDATRLPLIVLYDHGQMMRQKELAEAMAVESSSLFRILESLRKKELVTWEPDPNDRRAKCISLTPSGKTIAAKIHDRSLEIEHLVLEGIPPEEIALTRAVLERALSRLSALQSDLPRPSPKDLP